MATPTFLKINFSQIKSESRWSSGGAREKCGSTSIFYVKISADISMIYPTYPKNWSIDISIIIDIFILGWLLANLHEVQKSWTFLDETLPLREFKTNDKALEDGCHNLLCHKLDNLFSDMKTWTEEELEGLRVELGGRSSIAMLSFYSPWSRWPWSSTFFKHWSFTKKKVGWNCWT